MSCVLLDRADGEAFAREAKRQQEGAFVLTPVAADPLLASGLPFREPTAAQYEWANARAVVEARKWAKWLSEATEGAGLSSAGLFAFDRLFWRANTTGGRLWAILRGEGPYQYRAESGWRATEDRQEVFGHVIRQIAGKLAVPDFLPAEPGVAWRYKVMAHRLALRKRLRGALFYNTIRKHFDGLAGDVLKVAPKLAQFGAERVFRPTREEAATHERLLAEENASSLGRFFVLVDEAAYRRARELARDILQRIAEPRARMVAEAYQEVIVAEVAVTEGYARWFDQLFFWHRPKALLLGSMSTGLNVAMAQAAQKRRVPVFLVSHCSVGEGPLASPLHRAALENRNKDLCASPFADFQVVQSPHAEQTARQLDASAALRPARSVIWGSRKVGRPTAMVAQRFVILHAGNFQAWPSYEPFSSECSHEYLYGILEIAQAVRQLPAASLVIRMKPNHDKKNECLQESVQARLPEGDYYRISTGGSFYDELAQADLVVSSTSTVLEEALLSHIPVLLHSGGRIKPFFPARTTPPTAADRAAVYALEKPEEIGAMLTGIVSAHAGRPLTDEEVRPHCYEENIPDRARFAEYLVRQKDYRTS